MRHYTAAEQELRLRFEAHFESIGFVYTKDGWVAPDNPSKEDVRRMSHEYRRRINEKYAYLVSNKGEHLSKYIADGSEVDPAFIKPMLQVVYPKTFEDDLYNFGKLFSSIPSKDGIGRRMRFIVIDEHTQALMGLFSFSDPPLQMSDRDHWIMWDNERRKTHLTSVLNANTIMAVPPYSHLLGGKLMGALVGSGYVSAVHNERYPYDWVLATTMSALGRSSIYNRLKVPDGIEYISVGYTLGSGNWHVPQNLLNDLQVYLEEEGYTLPKSNRLMSMLTTGSKVLGLKKLAYHGISREIFVMPLIKDVQEFLCGYNIGKRKWLLRSVDEIVDWWKTRWMHPRSERMDNWKKYDSSTALPMIQRNVRVPLQQEMFK